MADRKERLKALARKAGRNQDPEEDTGGDADRPTSANTENEADGEETARTKKSLKFRNYSAANDGSQNDADEEEREAKRAKTEDTHKTALQLAAERARQDVLADRKNIDELAPKKINWDLKKGIESKLAKLEKRTQRAIVQMLRERLEKEAAEGTD